MHKRFSKPSSWLTAVVLFFFASSGCEKSEPGKASSDAAAKSSDQTVGVEEVMAKLATADAIDGKVDKVISRCASCSLGMDGSEEHSLEAHGYTMHFCTAECKDQFAAGLDKEIMAMKVPAK